MKQQFIEDKTGTLRLSVYDKNFITTPSSATVTLYDPSGNVLQSAAAATVGSNSEMTYALTTTHTATKGLNFKAVWSYVINGVTYQENQLFDVVLNILSIPITDDDLYAELDSLRKAAFQQVGTATSGTASTIVDTVNIKQEDDFWKGGTVEIIEGVGAGQVRSISGNAQSTGTISVSPNWATTPDSTSVFRVVRSFYQKIFQAFKKIEQMLYDKGKRHELIIESSQIEVPLLYLTIHFIAVDLMDEEGDKWNLTQKLYWDKFNAAFNSLKLEYDEDESGTISGDEAQTGPGSLRISRS